MAWLKLSTWLWCALLVPLCWSAEGPEGSRDPRVLARSVQEKQRKSVAAMEGSLARQRRAVAQFRQQAPSTTAGTRSPEPDCAPLPETQVDALISAAVTRESVPPDLLRGVMKQESGFRPCAVSPKGAMGLMQLMPATAVRFGVKDAFDTGQNVAAGARFLRELLARYGGDLSLALAAYNAGPEKVDAVGAVPDIAETKDYVRKILADLPRTEPRK
jgi:soluble lytic murein transglycosylase-like protein